MFSPIELEELFKEEKGNIVIPNHFIEHVSQPNLLSTIINPLIIIESFSEYKNIVILGIHGWDLFPLISKWIYKHEDAFLSHKFCQMTKETILEFYHEHFPEKQVEITVIPLIGHGIIEERVSNYKKLLVDKYVKILKEADLIICSTHSQGSPVTFILLSELIDEKIINFEKRIGIISMAGLNHGTTYNPYRMGWLGKIYQNALKELYEMRDHGSKIYQKYLTSVKYLLSNGVRVACFGSISDSVIDLYSSMMDMVDSSNILRALFLNKNIYEEINKKSKMITNETEKSDLFFISLVLFCIKLRNLGYYESHLIQMISEYVHDTNVESHTLIHTEKTVYKKGFEWIIQGSPSKEKAISRVVSHEPKDYLKEIPDILEKQKVFFEDDFMELQSLYLQWHPTHFKQIQLKKALKSVFEIKSKL